MKIQIGNIYSSNFCGDFKIIEYHGTINKKPYYKIKFLKTNYETVARYDTIKSGNINDPYYPKIYNIGYIGENDYIDPTIYSRWRNMLSRCYNPNSQHYDSYGGKGIKVCDRWHSYANFAEDFKKLNGYIDMINNPNIKYHLDKDILQQGIKTCDKIYSPVTCMLVPIHVNALQNSIDNNCNHSNSFTNVIYHHGAYDVRLQINGITYNIGRYIDEIIAANAANHAREFYGLQKVNDVKFIPKNEVNKYNIRKPKEMCKIVNK